MQKLSREKRVRRIATRRGYSVTKSRARDPLATGFARWTVTGPRGRKISPKGGWTLEQAEAWLAQMWEHSGG
jgi:hypothetical protein